MKYMTLEWWRGDEEPEGDERQPYRLYKEYIESVQSKLSGNLKQYIKGINLHDAMVVEFYFDAASGKLDFLLDVSYPAPGGPSAEEYHRTRVVYEQVAGFRSTAAPGKAMGGPKGYGHLLADELEVLGDGLIEHRWLFSSSIELQIQFKELQWGRVD